MQEFHLEQGLIVPSDNVATIARKACVIEGVSRSRNALINGDTRQYDWDSGYTCHQLGSGCIVVQLPQPYMLDSMRLLLWDCDDRRYCYYIETSCDNTNWTMVCDKRKDPSQSWQIVKFPRRPVTFVKIVGTLNTANEVFHCVHFETPSQDARPVPVSSGSLSESSSSPSLSVVSPPPSTASPSSSRPTSASRTHQMVPSLMSANNPGASAVLNRGLSASMDVNLSRNLDVNQDLQDTPESERAERDNSSDSSENEKR